MIDSAIRQRLPRFVGVELRIVAMGITQVYRARPAE
jgi:hypothetical protein